MDFRWHQIQTFVEVARHPSFTSAAKSLYVTRPALIQQINALEHSLGFTLFSRGKSGVSLTEAGKAFLEGMTPLIGQVEDLVKECRRANGQLRTLKVGEYAAWVSERLQMGSLYLFSLQHPDIMVESVPTSRATVLEDCRRGKIDVAEYYGPPEEVPQELVHVAQATSNLSAIVSREDPLASLASIKPADLVGRTVLADENYYTEAIGSWMNAEGGITLERTSFDIQTVIRRCATGCVALMPSTIENVFMPLEARPLNPPLEYGGGYVYRSAVADIARDFIAFAVGESAPV